MKVPVREVHRNTSRTIFTRMQEQVDGDVENIGDVKFASFETLTQCLDGSLDFCAVRGDQGLDGRNALRSVEGLKLCNLKG